MPDVGFENGGLCVSCADDREMSLFENSHVNGERVSEPFRPEDARRFAEALRTRKASHG
jgi:hypothetical protein